jgi:integrase
MYAAAVAGGRQRSAWGSVRRLPSGRYQARHRADGVWRAAPTTFTTKRDAEAFLAATRADLERGTWLDPDAGKVRVRDYAVTWLVQRPNLRPRSREGYEILLRLHILPELGNVELSKLSPSRVRGWHSGLLNSGKPGPPTVAKCYRLLHAILATAVEDELIVKNSAALRGASTERPAERPVATVEQVYGLANAIGPRYRAMVLLATFAGLRLGELRALRRNRLDLLHRTVQVVEQYQELSGGELVLGPPKTDAGRRTVSIPDVLISDLETHLENFAAPGPNGLVFCSEDGPGKPLNRKPFYRAWGHATEACGLDGFRFHDLRHTGNTLAAATGASTKELMARMGHASPRAALIYQHATRDRDAAIAQGLSDLITIATPTKPRATVTELPSKKRAKAG